MNPAALIRSFTAVLTTLLLGLIVGVQVARDLEADNDAARRLRFESESNRLVRDLKKRMELYSRGLRGLRGAVLAARAENFDLAAMHRYSESRDYTTEFPGSRGYGVIRRVPPDDTTALLSRMEAEQRPRREIRELGRHDGDHWVIEYVEPEHLNLDAVGLDVVAEPRRRAALEQAVSSGRAALTAPITLVQATGHPNRGFLLMLPIYRPDLSSVPSTERRERASTLAYAVLIIDEILADLGFAPCRDSAACPQSTQSSAGTSSLRWIPWTATSARPYWPAPMPGRRKWPTH